MGAGEEIDGYMVMVVVPGKEAEGAPVGGEMKAERLVEGLGDVEVAYSEVDVAEAGGRGKAGPFGGIEGSEGFEIERERVHRDFAVLPLPLFVRAVGVNFDAVAFWIRKVECFADEMVRGADEIPTMACGVADK